MRGAMGSPLFAAYPELARTLPWTPLGHFPTRVHRMERLAADTGVRELWVKRDDESGEIYGGNKVRKLEHLLADAERQGARRIEAIGGLGSNLFVACALYGAARGLEVRCHAFPHEMGDHGRANLRVVLGSGARVELVRPRTRVPIRILLGLARTASAGDGARSYWLVPGASSPLGTAGYVGGAFELKEQVNRGEMPEPDVIVVPLGSGGTLAGLVLGARLAGLRSRVVGVRVVSRLLASSTTVAVLANATAALLRRAGASLPRGRVLPGEVEVIHDFFGGAYGRSTPAAKDAVARIGRLESIPLETTYTGKALAGLLDLVRRERLHRRVVLFWNTVSSVDLCAALAGGPVPEGIPPEIRGYL
jgi:D-cysteine desulfhydrase